VNAEEPEAGGIGCLGDKAEGGVRGKPTWGRAGKKNPKQVGEPRKTLKQGAQI